MAEVYPKQGQGSYILPGLFWFNTFLLEHHLEVGDIAMSQISTGILVPQNATVCIKEISPIIV